MNFELESYNFFVRSVLQRQWSLSPDHNRFDPQPNKGEEGTESLHNISVVSASFLDQCTQLGVTVGANRRKYTADYPNQ